MGRESDYKSQIEKQNETEEELSEKAIKKLHKESLKSSELAAYLLSFKEWNSFRQQENQGKDC